VDLPTAAGLFDVPPIPEAGAKSTNAASLE